MPGLSSLNKILKAVKAGDISPSYARKAKRAIGQKQNKLDLKSLTRRNQKKIKLKELM